MEGGAATALAKARLDGTVLKEKTCFSPQTPQRGSRHFGCRISISGGMLYLSIGDRGNRDFSQDMTSHNGAVIRIAPEDGAAEIFTKGHRNPQGMAIHPASGAIWVNEHGPKGGDEINILREGENYGWPVVSHGREYFGGTVGEGSNLPPAMQTLSGSGAVDRTVGDGVL